jgi:predicted RNA-binding protein with TRAM domain
MADKKFRGDFSPVSEGEEFDVKIEAVGEKGDGIARVKGFVLFVPKTKSGDEVRVKINRVLRKVGFAEVISHITRDSKKSDGTKETKADTEEVSQPEETYDESLDSEDFGDDAEKKE